MTAERAAEPGRPRGARKFALLSFGDAVLDVVVALERLTVPDDDVPADITVCAGGQAANVAAWAVALGASGAVVSRVGADPAGRLVRELLSSQGVELLTPEDVGRTGAVTSLVTPDGRRTMASDRAATERFDPAELDARWFARRSWLHVSGYALLGEGSWQAALRAAELARRAGAGISVDLSSATAVGRVGPGRLASLVEQVEPDVVFANAAEHAAAGEVRAGTVVVKHGASGCAVHRAGAVREHRAVETSVVDTTGAGDAFAAGYLLGGVELALEAARRCVARRGAMPPAGTTSVADPAADAPAAPRPPERPPAS